MSRLKTQTAIGEFGEQLFENYLNAHGILFDREPPVAGTLKLVDYRLKPRDAEPIFAEVKTIYVPPPTRPRPRINDPYLPVRSHIDEAYRNFKAEPFRKTLNCVILVNFPGSFCDLRPPHVMLGSMYGDAGYQIPFNAETGAGDASQMTSTFIRGRGRMLHARPQNTRIGALISLHNPDPYFPAIVTARSEAEAFEMYRLAWMERLRSSTEKVPYVTVWENVLAARKFDPSVFAGNWDASWTHDGEAYSQAFVGSERRAKQLIDLAAGEHSEW